MATLPAYAELHCRSNFSFLTGASAPEELVERAAALRYTALAVTDECSLSGVVHAYEQACERGLPLIIGAEMRLEASVGGVPMRLVLLATTRRGYGNLSQWITVARRRAEKGYYDARTSDLEGRVPTMPHLAGLPDCLALLLPTAGPVALGAVGIGGTGSGAAPVPEAEAAPVNARLSGLGVIAAAQASAAAALASSAPGAGRPRGREVRETRDGPSGDGPLEPPAPPKLATTAAARRATRLPPPPRPSTALSFESLFAQAQWLRTWFGEDRAWLAMPLLMQGDDDEVRERVKAVSAGTGPRTSRPSARS